MKTKICLTLDDEILKSVDLKRTKFRMKRSPYINMRLSNLLKKRTRMI